MSSNKPLQYESLKCVLQYMEPNLRYQLSNQIPTLRVTEKLVPLRIDAVYFDRLKTQVNDTTYSLGIYREYPEGYKVPKDHKEENAEGGYQTDLTEHGFEVVHNCNNVTPGDVDLSAGIILTGSVSYGRYRIPDNEELYLRAERGLKVLKKALAIKQQQESSESKEVESGDLYPRMNFSDLEERKRFEREVRYHVHDSSIKRLRKDINFHRSALVSYRCRRDNIPLPYTQVIQLTVESPEGKRMFRHPYNIKLHEAMKKLNAALFRRNIFVRSFNITNYPLVVRLPVGLRVRCRELEVQNDFIKSHYALKAVIADSSYPLDVLTISYPKMEIDQFNHPIVKSAGTLNIHLNRFTIERDNFQPILHGLENKNVNLRQFSNHNIFPVADQVQLIQQWVDQGKDIGTTFSYEVKDKDSVEELFDEVGHGQKNFIVLPMSNGNNLEIQCAPLENQTDRARGSQWKVEMRVVAGAE